MRQDRETQDKTRQHPDKNLLGGFDLNNTLNELLIIRQLSEVWLLTYTSPVLIIINTLISHFLTSSTSFSLLTYMPVFGD